MVQTGVNRPAWRRIPIGIWAIGLTSLFMDISSEMIHALLPLYLVGAMGASTALVGLIEGIAEATAAITKVFSGALSDWLGRRKWLGRYRLWPCCADQAHLPARRRHWLADGSALHRPDRKRHSRCAARCSGRRHCNRRTCAAPLSVFVNRWTLSALFLGPLLAIVIMALSAGDFQLTFWIAVIPAFVCVAVLLFAVKEPQAAENRTPREIAHFRHTA